MIIIPKTEAISLDRVDDDIVLTQTHSYSTSTVSFPALCLPQVIAALQSQQWAPKSYPSEESAE